MIVQDIRKKLRGLVNDFLYHGNTMGWPRALFWLLKTLVFLPVCKIEYTVLACSLRENLPVIKPQTPVIIRRADRMDLDRLKKRLLPSQRRRYTSQIENGRYFFIAFDRNHPVGYCWTTPDVKFNIDNFRMCLKPEETYGGDSYTFPEYRRQGIQTALQLFRMNFMKKLGFERMILIVDVNNLASRDMLLKIGYREVDRLSFRRTLWKRIYRYHSGKF